MDKTRDNLRAVSWRHFPPHAEDADCAASCFVHSVGHRITGPVPFEEDRFPVNRILRGDHVDGCAPGHILGDVDSPRKSYGQK